MTIIGWRPLAAACVLLQIVYVVLLSTLQSFNSELEFKHGHGLELGLEPRGDLVLGHGFELGTSSDTGMSSRAKKKQIVL